MRVGKLDKLDYNAVVGPEREKAQSIAAVALRVAGKKKEPPTRTCPSGRSGFLSGVGEAGLRRLGEPWR